MSLKNENGYIGTYRDKKVCVVSQKYYEEHRKSFKDEFVVLLTGKDNGVYDFIFNGKIVGAINDSKQINIARDSIDYDKKYWKPQETISMENRREYVYKMKDNDDDDVKQQQHHREVNMEELAKKVSDIILDGLATGNRLLKEEQERAEKLCR